jgi:hypothetical protein
MEARRVSSSEEALPFCFAVEAVAIIISSSVSEGCNERGVEGRDEEEAVVEEEDENVEEVEEGRGSFMDC